MKLVKAMATVAGLTGLSRIAGFARDVLTASYLGAGPIADAFFVALKLPNFFRRVTAEGAFSIAFVPIYAKKLELEGQEKADQFASNAFMVMLCALSIFTLLALMFMPYLIMAIAPGFGDEGRFDLAVEFSRITFPYLLFMSLTALLGGVLNAHNRFAPFAVAPVLFNLSLIAAILASDDFDTVGHALSCGLFVAGVLQFLYLLMSALKSNVRIEIKMPKLDADAKRVLRLMGPAVLGAGVVHINLFVDLIIGSFLEEGSISYLYYADRLNQLPLGVVGIAVGTALLPILSKAMTQEDVSEARDLYNRALEYCLLLALPAAIALAVIPLPLITVLFERGAFDATDSMTTAGVLMAYAIGLPAYISVKVFSTVHWSREDTKTPVKISIVATVLNIILSLISIQFIGVIGIALATGLTGWLQFYLHIQALKGHESARLDARFVSNAPKIILSSCIMGAGVYGLAQLLWVYLFEGAFILQISVLVAVVSLGVLLYTACALMFKIINPKDVKSLLRKRRKS